MKFSKSIIRMRGKYKPKDPEPICSFSLNLPPTRTMSTLCKRGRHATWFNAPVEDNVFRCIVIEGDGTCKRQMVIRSVALYLLLFLIWKLTVYKMVEDRGTVEINIGVQLWTTRALIFSSAWEDFFCTKVTSDSDSGLSKTSENGFNWFFPWFFGDRQILSPKKSLYCFRAPPLCRFLATCYVRTTTMTTYKTRCGGLAWGWHWRRAKGLPAVLLGVICHVAVQYQSLPFLLPFSCA